MESGAGEQLRHEPTLTPEQETRSNRDIRTIANLSAKATELGMIPTISGGYAVDAYCSGKISRPHGDIDIGFFSLSSPNHQAIEQEINSLLLSESHYTKWAPYPPDEDKRADDINNGHIEFRETGKDLIPFSERRRLEAYVMVDPNATDSWVTKKQLLDSEGEAYDVNVTRIPYLVADKMRIIYERSQLSDAEKASLNRPTKHSDYDDIKRLINSPDFTPEAKAECLNVLDSQLNRNTKDGIKHDPSAIFSQITSAH
ncbi:hypothetical protein BH09PAT1_BH09PAT1_4320 [soil metagenome]